MVDLHRQYLGIRDEVDRAIGDVIAETAFIKGPAVGLFEEELARRLEVRHCIACGNGTDALLLSLLAVGLQRGDEVIVPAFAFAAVAETVLLLGGLPTSIPALSISTRRASPGWCRSVPVSSSPSICSGSRAIWLRSRPLRRSTA